MSEASGPASTIWAKPLSEGTVALLAINGADMPQEIALDFGDLLQLWAKATTKAWATRDVWAAKDLGPLASLSPTLAPHDCALLVLSPVGAEMVEK